MRKQRENIFFRLKPFLNVVFSKVERELLNMTMFRWSTTRPVKATGS